MSFYRNNGAPWRRPDGTVIEKGAEFEPTDEELLRKAYKLEYVGPESGRPVVVAGSGKLRDRVADFYQGGGWYVIGGESVQGRDAAFAALEAVQAEARQLREAEALDEAD